MIAVVINAANIGLHASKGTDPKWGCWRERRTGQKGMPPEKQRCFMRIDEATGGGVIGPKWSSKRALFGANEARNDWRCNVVFVC